MYYESGIPSIFESALEDGNGEAVREWLEEQRTEDTIEEVTEEMLQHLASTLNALHTDTLYFTRKTQKSLIFTL